MIYIIQGNQITVGDALATAYECVTGNSLTQEEVEFLTHGALKKHLSGKELETYVIEAVEGYIKVGRRLSHIVQKIENGDIETVSEDVLFHTTYNINGQEILVDNNLVLAYERAMGIPLTELKIRSMYDTVIDDCTNITDINSEIRKLILEYISVAKDIPDIMYKIKNGEIDT